MATHSNVYSLFLLQGKNTFVENSSLKRTVKTHLQEHFSTFLSVTHLSTNTNTSLFIYVLDPTFNSEAQYSVCTFSMTSVWI